MLGKRSLNCVAASVTLAAMACGPRYPITAAYDPKTQGEYVSCPSLTNENVRLEAVTRRRVVGVTVQSGGPVSGVQIVLRSRASKRPFVAVSDQAGAFEFPPLASGLYDAKVCLAGFNLLEFEVVVGPEASDEPLEIEMQLGT